MPSTMAFGAREDLRAPLPAAARIPDRPPALDIEKLPGLNQLQHTGEAAADPGSSRQVDELQWRQNCADVKEVMVAAKSVYLALEHHNEAVIRVALEAVTDPVARKCLWWNDNWFGECDKRDQWRNVVKTKLPVVIGHVTNSQPMMETTVDADPTILEATRQRAEQADMAWKTAQQQLKIIEMRCLEFQEMEAKAREQVRSMEEILGQLRAELRRSEEDCTSVKERLAAQEGQLKDAEKHKAAALQRAAEQEKRAKAAEDSLVASEQKLKKSEEAFASVEAKLKAAVEKIKALQPSTLQNRPLATKSDDKALDEMAGKLQVAKKRNVELEEQLRQANSANSELQRELNEARCQSQAQEMPDVSEDMESLQLELMAEREGSKTSLQRVDELSKKLEHALARAQNAETRAKAAEELAATLASRTNSGLPPKPSSPDKSVQVGALMREIEMQTEQLDDLRRKTKEQDLEVSELRKANAELERELEEFRAKIHRKDDRIAKLLEDKAALEEERMNMLRSIHALRQKLKRITEIAEKKGYGKIVSEIMSEAEIPQTLEGPEFSCFERLYQDALRRQRDHKDRIHSRVSAASPTHGAAVPVVQPQLGIGFAANRASATTESYGLQRVSSNTDLGGTGGVSASPLPPGNAGFQRGSVFFHGQSTGTASGARVSVAQPWPSNLGRQVAVRDVLQRGMSTRSSSIGRLLVRSSVNLANQTSPDALTPTPPPSYLPFSRFVPEGLNAGVLRRSRSPSPTETQLKLTRSRTEPGNLPVLEATPENINPNSTPNLTVTGTLGAAKERAAMPAASDGTLNQTLGRMRGCMLVGRHQSPSHALWEPSKRVLYRAPRDENDKKAAQQNETVNLGGGRTLGGRFVD